MHQEKKQKLNQLHQKIVKQNRFFKGFKNGLRLSNPELSGRVFCNLEEFSSQQGSQHPAWEESRV